MTLNLQDYKVCRLQTEEKENWPKYNKDLNTGRKKKTQLFSIITVAKTCKLGKMARAVDEGLGEISFDSNLDNA